MKKTKLQIPFWFQIVAILSIGVISSIVLFFIVKESRLPVYTVTFAYQNGDVIEKNEVKEGKGVYPPNFEYDGVFRGWSTPLNDVASDMESHPMIYTIAEDNLFYFDSVYVKEGDTFNLDLYVAGQVNITSAELNIDYDLDVLQFLNADSSFCNTIEKEDGVLAISFELEESLKEKTKLCSIEFKSKRKDAYSTELMLSAISSHLKLNGDEYNVDCATINNKIYFLQEISK